VRNAFTGAKGEVAERFVGSMRGGGFRARKRQRRKMSLLCLRSRKNGEEREKGNKLAGRHLLGKRGQKWHGL